MIPLHLHLVPRADRPKHFFPLTRESGALFETCTTGCAGGCTVGSEFPPIQGEVLPSSICTWLLEDFVPTPTSTGPPLLTP